MRIGKDLPAQIHLKRLETPMKHLFVDEFSDLTQALTRMQSEAGSRLIRSDELLWAYFPSDSAVLLITDNGIPSSDTKVERGTVIVVDGICRYREAGKRFSETVEAHALVTESGLFLATAVCKMDIDYGYGVRRRAVLTTDVSTKRGAPGIRQTRQAFNELIADACWLPYQTPKLTIDWPDVGASLSTL
jgi:hypothetical protein